MYNVIATGSKGNAILYHGSILVDCGIPFSFLENHLYSLQVILLTHSHGDHFNLNTIKKLSDERPSLRFGCCEWLVDEVKGVVRNLDVYEVGNNYDYGAFSISPVQLYHDVLNCGYRIFKNDHKLIHITDTAHVQGISAKDYDLYAIEHNYNDETIDEIIARKEAVGDFCHNKRAVGSHLSEQQARDFIFENRKESSEVLRLHESDNA